MIAPAREAAFEVLLAVGTGRADLPAALAHARRRLTDERDRALAAEIATGTLRWQAAFDHVIASFTGRRLQKLDHEVLVILRLTIFQLLHSDRIPASAAVNDAVQLARKAGKTSATGLVNAVLRRVSRERRGLPLPSRPENADAEPEAALDYLSIALSHPRWLMTRWKDRFGFEAAAQWARFDNSPARLTIRANRLRTTPEALTESLARHGVVAEPARFAPDGLIVVEGNPLLTPLAREGLFLVQDEASQLVGILPNVQPGELVLDACASPGGKTTQMASRVGDGMVVASDVRPRRVALLAETIAAAGPAHVRLVRADAQRALPFGGVFDCVLLDAPCSGLGTLRRDPDIRWRRSEEELARLAAAQLAMLKEAAATVAPGGRIVYSTCSSEPEENEEVVAQFLRDRQEYSLAPATHLPDAVRPFASETGHFRTYPFRDGLEGFFAAMLVKTKDLR